MASIKKNQFLNLLREGSFKELFVSELGWNRYRGQAELPAFAVDDKEYRISTIAERSGFQVLFCEVDELPTQSLAKKIDVKLRRQANDYICIYRQRGTSNDIWVVPVRSNEKRNIIIVECDADKADFLYSKIDGFSFDFDEETTILDLRDKVQGAFTVNSEKITKDFYSGFKKEHKAFADFITGIDDHVVTKDNRNKQWYTSVMLNRLMFCYFIQKKGFLNLDFNYLRNKLNWVRQQQGENRFFKSFYRGFLSNLFHDGLNSPDHDREFERMYGKIPYLNGGMFDEHQLERDYADIDIADEAFMRLFDFFDTWRWHLDTRITASGKDINPDVLGYIFEQYINDRAQMGAYYTKEDITEYIGKNCILPFLVDRLKEKVPAAFKSDGYVWQLLKNSGTRYIYDAVIKGYTSDWQDKIPGEIARGIITADMRREYSETPLGELPDSHIPLSELRSKWNTKTPEEFALPTEIWRETIERFQRVDELLANISGGKIQSINDFITYNLDIRAFVYDLLALTGDHSIVRHFYNALKNISILDPTCGSGAFLFAAMNILEPLYEVCIERMQEFNASNPALFKTELAEIANKYRSNIQYFIFKSIILRNLYGVDIMVEATEIAKLRLFLKMVAVVEVDRRADNLGLDPLPDIDFNIRCGNTLVGYANEKELDRDLSDSQGSFEIMLANEEFKTKIDEEMQKVAKVFDVFKRLQLVQELNMAEFKQAKHDLQERLAKLNDLLNHRLFQASGQADYDKWLASHQPFNWLAEFYQIIHDNGGFDVIIGNPPYVEYSDVCKTYTIGNCQTKSCGNLYAYVMERSKEISNEKSFIGMIVPLSGHSTERMSPLVKNFYQKFGLHLHLNLSADANPQRLFEGVKFRLGIFFVSQQGKGIFSSKYTRWLAEERSDLFFSTVRYTEISNYQYLNIIGKIGNKKLLHILGKIQKEKSFLCSDASIGEPCLYHNTPVNWIRAHSFIPYFKSEKKGEGASTQLKQLIYSTPQKAKVATAILTSSHFFIWWLVNSDCYHLNKPELTNFGYNYSEDRDTESLVTLANFLATDMVKKSARRVYVYKSTGRVEYDEFYMKKSKSIIDKIDTVLARHYGFTAEELDFIINYDIKYRMGDELNN